MISSKKRTVKIDRAVKAAVEALEGRMLLSAGQVDPTWGVGGAGYIGQQEDLIEYYEGSLYDTTPKFNRFFDWQDRVVSTNPASLEPTSGFISNHDVFVDAGGQILTVGGTLGRHLVATPDTKWVITDPGNLTKTMEVNVVEMFDSDLSVVRYDGQGNRTYMLAPSYTGNGANPQGDRDYVAQPGDPAYPPNINQSSQLYDDARAGAIDNSGTPATNPNYGSILVAGTNWLYPAGSGNSMTLVRYFPRTGMVTEIMKMTAPGIGAAWSVNDMAVQADGKIVVVGSQGNGLTGSDFVVWRFNADFTLDTTFGNGGTARTNFHSYSEDEAMAVAIQPAMITNSLGAVVPNPDAGKIVVVGYTDDSSWLVNGKASMVIARYNTNGTFDTTWGINGILQIADFGGQDGIGTAVKIQSDGKVLALGAYDSSPGVAIDPLSFDPLGNPMPEARDNYLRTAALDSTVLVRINADGTLDQNAFGARGRVQISGTNPWVGESLALESNGKIIIGGVTTDATGTYAAATRITTDGRLDNLSYGAGGFVTLTQLGNNILPDLYYKVSVTVQSDDKAILAANRALDLTWSGGYYGAAGMVFGKDYFIADGVIARIQADNKAPQAQLLSKDVTVKDATTQYVNLLVNYSDDGYINQNTILSNINSILVTGPGGFQQYAQIVGAPVGAGATDGAGNYSQFTVTYRVTRPAAGWTNGAYSVQLFDDKSGVALAGVADTNVPPAYSPARMLGQFDAQVIPVDTLPPVAKVLRLPAGSATDGNFGITVGGGTSLDFILSLTDDLNLINFARLATGNILVTGPSGYSQIATFVGATDALGNAIQANDNPVYARYRITAPHGTWNTTDNGAYSIQVRPNQISDTYSSPNFVVAGEITKFNVSVVPTSDVRPTAFLSDANGNKVAVPPFIDPVVSQTLYVHYVPSVYSTSGQIDLASIANNDNAIRVVSASPAYDRFATFVSATPDSAGTGYVVTYALSQPLNIPWTGANNGSYVVRMAANQVGDKDGPPNYVPAGDLGAFTVNIPDQAVPVVVLVPPILVPVPATAIYRVTVTYIDDLGIDASSITAGDLSIVSDTGVSLSGIGTPVITPAGNGTPRTVTYTFAAPGGLWNFAANGTYTIAMKENRVRDTSGKFVAPGTLGTFDFEVVPPQIQVAISPIVLGPGNLTVTLTLTDPIGVDVNTITPTSILVGRSDGGPAFNLVLAGPPVFAGPNPTIDIPTNGSPRVATYTFLAPGGFWEWKDNGTYQVRVMYDDSTVPITGIGNVAGAFVAPGPVATFQVAFAPDTRSPVATVISAPTITAFDTDSYAFQVQYTDNVSVDYRTLGADTQTPIEDIEVIGPGGVAYTATLVQNSLNPNTFGATITAYYRIDKPGGFTFEDNGVYIIRMKADTVRDVSGNAVGMGPIGQFIVQVPDIVPPCVKPDNFPAPTQGTATYQLSVLYYDGGSGIDLTTIANTNLQMIRPGSPALTSAGAPVVNSLDPDNHQVRVTYTFNAPGGIWNFPAEGTYEVWMLANQVGDKSGNWVPAGLIGPVDFVFQNEPPVVTTVITPPVVGPANFVVTLTITDDVAVDLGKIDADAISVVRTAGGSLLSLVQIGQPVFDNPTNGTPRTVTFTFAAPGADAKGQYGFWQSGDNGTWQVILADYSIVDTQGASVPGGPLATFQVAFPVDNVPPVATVLSAPPITATGATSYVFQIQYTDNVAVDFRTIGDGNIQVIAPDGTCFNATLVQDSVNPVKTFAGAITAYYRFDMPGGFTFDDNGVYLISMQPNSVEDVSGNAVTSGPFGQFTVQVPDVIPPTVAEDNFPAPTQGTATYQLSVLYCDAQTGIDLKTIANTNLRVLFGSLALTSAGAPLVNALDTDNHQVCVTYTFNAPGGIWNYPAQGTYQVWMVANQVRDLSGNAVAPGQIGSFDFVFENEPPVVTAAITPPVIGPANFVVTLTITDDVAVNMGKINASTISVLRTAGGSPLSLVQIGQPVFNNPTNGTPRTVTFTFAAPGADAKGQYGFWQSGANGTWQVILADNGVVDTLGAAAPGGPVATFQVAFPVDDVPPVATLLSAPSVTTTGVVSYIFQVQYTDNVAVDFRTIGNGDLVVIGPDGRPCNYTVTLVQNSVTPANTFAATITAYYRVDIPGAFRPANNGLYTIQMCANQVKDVSGVAVDPGAIGQFLVRVPDEVPPTVTLVGAPLAPPVEATTTYQVTVTYADPTGIDLKSITNANLQVIRAGSAALLATGTPSIQPGNTKNTKVTVTYTFIAPGGTWNYQDAGTYQINVVGGQVKDLSGNAALPQNVGSFTYVDLAPVASMAAPYATPTLGTGNITVTVRYEDDGPLDTTTFAASNIVVSRTSGGTPLTLVSAGAPTITPTAASPNRYKVSYIFQAPNGYWSSLANGTYTIKLLSNQVADVGGNYALGANVGTFVVNFTVDKAPPAATLVPASTTTPSIKLPVQSYDIVVRYDDNVAVDYRTLGTGDIVVTAPNGKVYYPSIVATAPANTFARTVTATYQLQIGGPIDATSNGTWVVKVANKQVADVSGNLIPNGAKVGSFVVACPALAVVATLTKVDPIQVGASFVNISVTYSSAYPVDISTLIGANKDQLVAISGPKGYTAFAKLVMPANPQSRLTQTLTYKVYAPSGAFSSKDNGAYILTIGATNGVKNTVGGTLRATNLGTINVTLPAGLSASIVKSPSPLALTKTNDLLA